MMVFRFYGFWVKPTASRKLTKKTFNGKKKKLTINSCNVKELLINKGLEISSSLGIILTKNLKRAFQSTMSSFLTFIMNYKAEDYHGRSCLFHGGNPLLLHTFRFVFIFSFIFLALKGFFLFAFNVDISLLFMGTLLQELQSVKFNFKIWPLFFI